MIKDYLALVRGGENMFTKKEGVITNPIQIDCDGRVSVSAAQDGKPALTTWELLGSSVRQTVATPVLHETVSLS